MELRHLLTAFRLLRTIHLGDPMERSILLLHVTAPHIRSALNDQIEEWLQEDRAEAKRAWDRTVEDVANLLTDRAILDNCPMDIAGARHAFFATEYRARNAARQKGRLLRLTELLARSEGAKREHIG